MEVVSGILRIETVLGPRPLAQYLLCDERSLLVDTGVATTPDQAILPVFAGIGLDPTNLDHVVITHADADHFGGNARIRAAAPRAVFCAHAADVAWITDRKRIVRERYGWSAAHGVGYPHEMHEWLGEAMGADVPVDLHLAGGEHFRLGPRLIVQVLNLPGHTPGHIGLWEPTSKTAIVTDAVLGSGLLDSVGSVISPPPYFDAESYESSIRLLMNLAPNRLLTAHYPVIEGAGVVRFLAESAAFVERARGVVTEELTRAGELGLKELLGRANARLGPFTVMENELAGPLRSHLQELVKDGRAYQVVGRQPPVWRVVG